MARGRCIRSSRPKKSKGVGSYSLTLPFFLVILSRFRKNVPARVSYGGSVRGTQPEHCGRVKPKGRVKLSRPISLDWLLSCEGRGIIASVSARFSTLEGYAGRHWRNGVGSVVYRRE